MRVLIVGAGVAGLSLAHALGRKGHEIVVVDKARRAVRPAHMIEFFGVGIDAARNLDLVDVLEAVHAPAASVVFHGPSGSEPAELPYDQVRREMFGDEHFQFPRGALEAALLEKIRGDVDVRFRIAAHEIRSDTDGARVILSDGTTHTADVVVGADGMHSTLRGMLFGLPEETSLRFAGYRRASFVVNDVDTARELGDAQHVLNAPGRLVTTYPAGKSRVACLFIHKSNRQRVDRKRGAALAELREEYGDIGWRVPQLLEGLARADDVRLDAISEVDVPQWSAGRVALVGDAAHGGSSLVASQGASLAMAGAFLLAEELQADREPRFALARYEARMRRVVDDVHRAANEVSRWRVPESKLALRLKNLAMRFGNLPIASGIVRRSFAAL